MFPRYASAIVATIVVLGGAVALANPVGLIAQSSTQASPAASLDRGASWLRELNLTADQVQRIQTIRGQYREQLTQQRQSVRKAQQEMRELMAGSASTDTVRQKHNQVKTLRQQLADTQFESILAIREVLTVEQRRQFAEQMQRRRGEFRNRRNRMERQGAGSFEF